MTQLEAARKGIVTPEMKVVLETEPLTEKELLDGIVAGFIVIPKNIHHSFSQIKAIGKGCKTKVNANIGTSPHCTNGQYEMKKLKAAVEAGADAMMDLSTGGNLRKIRQVLVKNCDVPIGTVPIYQLAVELTEKGLDIPDITIEALLEVIEQNGKDGVDFITVHCGLIKNIVDKIDQGYYPRLMPSVSRGGAMLMRWMRTHQKENPLYEFYDEILKIAKKYDMTLSLGDALRPGCQLDATDSAQIAELTVLGELQLRAMKEGVQVMIEGPGHIPLSHIKANVVLEKQLCHGAPFYVLGPLVTDVTPGYDHITSAIGGALAAAAGVDFLCYVTPAEHLRLPDVDDVKEGVIASRIAAHIGDMEKGLPGAVEWDHKMSRARKALDWEQMLDLAIDPEKARKYRKLKTYEIEECTMCGGLCSVKQSSFKGEQS